jgi:ABC-type nitrate/sulfonate/bicarbonate transport system substrate-binding protein
VPRIYFASKGLDNDKIHWAATGNEGNSVQALVVRRVDAAFLHVAESLAAFKRNPSLKVLVESGEFSKVAPATGAIVVVTDAYAKAHPEIVGAFVDSIIEANRRLYEDRSFFDAVVEKWMPGVYDASQKAVLYNAYQPSWGVNGGLNMKAFSSVLEAWKKTNPTGANNPYFTTADYLVDTSFAKSTLDRIGRMDGALDAAAWYNGAPEGK